MKIFILILWVTLIVTSMALAEEDRVYLLDLHYDNGKITLNNIKVENGFGPDGKIHSGDYRLDVVSFDNEVLYFLNFKATRLYSDRSDKSTGYIDGEVIDLKEADFSLIVPYFIDGKDIKIYREDNEVFSTDISKFSIRSSPKRNFTWLYITLAVLFIAFIIFFVVKRIKQ